MNYDPSVFNVDGLERAKWVILNPDGVHTPEQRWEVETEYLLKLMADWMPLKGAAILDWGCGIGRLSKPLIERHGCAALGVDISPSMRSLAVEYVKSPDFLCCDPTALRTLGRFGMQFDCAVAVWALQHVADLTSDLAAIKAALKPGGRLFVLNAEMRFVPTSHNGQFQWVQDDVDVWSALNREFVALQVQRADTEIVPQPPTLWGVFEAEVTL